MARANNKYTSINFNNILLQNDPPPSSSSSASYSSVARSNGRMLVLKRPSPKPLISPSSAPVTTTTPQVSSALIRTPDQALSDPDPDPDPDPNQISLRPLGHTGSGSSLSFPVPTKEVASPAPISVSNKPNRFVPPHLRPGFVRKDEKPIIDTSRARDPNLNLNPNQRLSNQEQHRQWDFGYGQTRRPRSGGYERNRTDPRSIGNRPGTSGWYVESLS